MRLPHLVSLLALTLAIASSVFFYPSLPAAVSVQWDGSAHISAAPPKWLGVALMPAVIVAIISLFLFMPKTGRAKNELEQFRNRYELLVMMFVLFAAYLHILMLLWNMKIIPSMRQLVAPILGINIFYGGMVMESITKDAAGAAPKKAILSKRRFRRSAASHPTCSSSADSRCSSVWSFRTLSL